MLIASTTTDGRVDGRRCRYRSVCVLPVCVCGGGYTDRERDLDNLEREFQRLGTIIRMCKYSSIYVGFSGGQEKGFTHHRVATLSCSSTTTAVAVLFFEKARNCEPYRVSLLTFAAAILYKTRKKRGCEIYHSGQQIDILKPSATKRGSERSNRSCVRVVVMTREKRVW